MYPSCLNRLPRREVDFGAKGIPRNYPGYIGEKRGEIDIAQEVKKVRERPDEFSVLSNHFILAIPLTWSKRSITELANNTIYGFENCCVFILVFGLNLTIDGRGTGNRAPSSDFLLLTRSASVVCASTSKNA